MSDWMTNEVIQALEAIAGPHREKKRLTVILMAVAAANNESEASVLSRKDTCNDSVWNGRNINGRRKIGWKDMPDIAAALEICKREALRWRDSETVRIESYYAQQRRRAVAEFAADVPATLADIMADRSQRGADRINAAGKLISLADPDTAQKVNLNQPVGGSFESNTEVNVGDDAIDAAIERELARLAGGAQATDAGRLAQPADASE